MKHVTSVCDLKLAINPHRFSDGEERDDLVGAILTELDGQGVDHTPSQRVWLAEHDAEELTILLGLAKDGKNVLEGIA